MNWLIDTNVLLRIAQPSHEMYADASRSLTTIANRGHRLGIIPQNLIEFWVVATRPIQNNGLGISPRAATGELLKFKDLFLLLPDTLEIFPQWEQLVAKYDVSGKQAHDTRLVAAMLVHNLTHLLTFNDRNFNRFTEITVVNPQDVVGIIK